MRTLTPCTPTCWYAQEKNCNCICNGINHGIAIKNKLAGKQSELPKRMIKKDGMIWELQTIGSHFDQYEKTSTLNTEKHRIEQNEPNVYLKIKYLTKPQRKWAEVEKWKKDQREKIPDGAIGDYLPVALWKLIDTKDIT